MTCGLDIDECINSRCVPQGTAQCNNLDNKYECECRIGFTGEFCETNTDNCASGPCLNGGECKDGEGSYTCSCPRGLFVYIYNFISILGFYFFFLMLKFHEFSSSLLFYPGWAGSRCENAISFCEDQPCENNAECVDLFEDYFCVCPKGTDGKNCETAPDRCLGSPCQNGGNCRDYGNSMNCSCNSAFTGIGCQYEFDACAKGACKNGATCIDNGGK